MTKDRGALFSRKHRRYWIPVLGGMILIGVLNVALGYCTYDPPSDTHERIHLNIPPPHSPWDAAVAPADAGGPR